MTTRYPRRKKTHSVAREAAAPERQVGIRDLKARLSEWIRLVKEGETVVVTEHGRPVARLVAPSLSARERMLALAATGEIVWNGEPFKPRRPVVRVKGGRSLSDLIVEERDEW